MRRSDPLTLTITVLSTVAVTSGLTLGLSERYVTSYAFCVEYRFISYDAVSTTSHTVSAVNIRMTLLPECYVLFDDCMYNCISNILSLRLSIVLYIGIGLAHALGLV